MIYWTQYAFISYLNVLMPGNKFWFQFIHSFLPWCWLYIDNRGTNIWLYSVCSAMVVNLTVLGFYLDKVLQFDLIRNNPMLLLRVCYPVCVKQDFKERYSEVEDQPHINHLDVGGFGKALRHRDQHCDKHQHDCQVHNYGRLRIFE